MGKSLGILMRAFRLFFCPPLIAILLAQAVTAPTLGPDRKLPADLVMTVGEHGADGVVRLRLVIWDAYSHVFTPWYSEVTPEVMVLRPLSWSPDGYFLAIYRVEALDPANSSTAGYVEQICVLNRDGALVSCADEPPQFANSTELADSVQQVSWAANGERYYFPVATSTETTLLEVDARTGRTIREVARFPDPTHGRYGTQLSWTPDLRHVVVGVGDFSRTLDYPTYLVNLETDQHADLTANVPNLNYVCFGFSPDGKYIVARVVDEHGNNGLAVLDQGGNISAQLDSQNGFGSLRAFCPLWAPDGASFYFIGIAQADEMAQLFQYTPSSDRLRIVYRLPGDPDPLVSQRHGALYQITDTVGGFVAANGLDNPNMSEEAQVLVIGPDGGREAILGQYLFSQDPLWIPPLQTPTPGS